MLSQADVAELQRLLSDVEMDEAHAQLAELTEKGVHPLLLFQLEYVKVHMYKEEGRHKTPHFHIEFKRQFRASYEISTLRRIVGAMPRKYEKPAIAWAASRREALMASWNSLIAGGEPVSFVEEEEDL